MRSVPHRGVFGYFCRSCEKLTHPGPINWTVCATFVAARGSPSVRESVRLCRSEMLSYSRAARAHPSAWSPRSGCRSRSRSGYSIGQGVRAGGGGGSRSFRWVSGEGKERQVSSSHNARPFPQAFRQRPADDPFRRCIEVSKPFRSYETLVSVNVPEVTCGMNNSDDLDDLVARSINDAIIAHENLAKFREASFLDRCPRPREPAQSIHGSSEAVDGAPSVNARVSRDERVNGPQISSCRVSPQDACHS